MIDRCNSYVYFTKDVDADTIIVQTMVINVVNETDALVCQ